jgi:hypothetical protein
LSGNGSARAFTPDVPNGYSITMPLYRNTMMPIHDLDGMDYFDKLRMEVISVDNSRRINYR